MPETASRINIAWNVNYVKLSAVVEQEQSYDIFTLRRVDQVPFLIPPPLLTPKLTPFLRFTMTVLMLPICPRLFVMFPTGPLLSGRRNSVAVLCLSLITATSVMGRKKYCRKSCFPWGVRAK